ncbi:MAG TPA: ribosome recycling factor [Acidimicrobiales bacterium]|nr:ribosome recycling factor [Acidimicrobiales bacterium]
MTADSIIEEAIEDAREKMARAVEHTKGEFGADRTGRASPVLVEKLKVDYYGTEVALQSLAGITVPEARTLVIHPYDKGAIKAIEKAIQVSDLGVNPSNDGEVVRLTFPQLNEERRRELVKVVRQRAEEGRVSVRNVRRHARHELEIHEHDGAVSIDDVERADKELDKLTHEFVAEIDRLLTHKEQELLEV